MKLALLIVLLSFPAFALRAEPSVKSWDGNYLTIFDLPKQQRVESFETLLASAVPSRIAAEKLALEYWVHDHRLLAEERLMICGLYRIGREMTGFANRNEWVWEVRVLHLDQGLDGTIWINAHSEKIRSFDPTSK